MEQSLKAKRLPVRSAIFSIGALAVPVMHSWILPDVRSDYDLLVWLVALIPAFILAYYRGWRGSAIALAGGMAAMSLAQVGLVATGGRVESSALLMTVVVVFSTMTLGVGWLAEMLHREQEQAAVLALTDQLTGLANRRLLQPTLRREFAAAMRGRPLTVVLWDIDNFKRYNDEHGHLAGDRALVAFARSLQRVTREMNLCARYGGEEFISLVCGAETRHALIFVQRVRDALVAEEPGIAPITVSAGVATYDPSMRCPDDLIGAADHALLVAKRDGRNCTRVHVGAASATGRVPAPRTSALQRGARAATATR